MATTYQQDRDFLEEMVEDNLLERSIEWIKDNITIDNVYDDDTIIEYVKENMEMDAVYGDEAITNYITDSYSPDDVFTYAELEEWARQNDFVKIVVHE